MKFVDTDLLIIGAGAAGCFAAIRASDFTKNVVLLEKATLRSGGNLSIGHFSSMINPMTNLPGSPNSKQFVEGYLSSSSGQTGVESPMDKYIIAEEIIDRTKQLEKWGLKFVEKKEDGTWGYFWNYRIGERMESGAPVKGGTIKPALIGELIRRGLKVYERTMAIDLLTYNGRVVGTVGLNVRTGEIFGFKAKATILATGSTSRCYAPVPGKNWFWMRDMGTNTGDGRGMALRAGADLTLMEFMRSDHMVGNVMSNTWGGICVNTNGEEFLEETYEKRWSRVWAMHMEYLEGRAPCYWDSRNVSEEDRKAILFKQGEKNYPDISLEQSIAQRGLDPRKERAEIKLMPVGLLGGPEFDENGGTSLEGLYAVGDEVWQDSMCNAFVFGYRAGEAAAKYCLKADALTLDEEQVKAIDETIQALTRRREGVTPMEIEEKIRTIMTYYANFHKTGGMLERGLELLLEIKEKLLPQLYAKNVHELMRAMEVRNILAVAEMHIRSALMRTESRVGGRHFHHRLDFPDPDSEWYRQRISIRMENGEMKLYRKLAPEQRVPTREDYEAIREVQP